MPAVAGTQQATFTDVKVRTSKSATDRLYVNKGVDLVLDDAARRLIVKSKERPLDIAYHDVQRIVFDRSVPTTNVPLSVPVAPVYGRLIRLFRVVPFTLVHRVSGIA